jgi:hypothetical protein
MIGGNHARYVEFILHNQLGQQEDPKHEHPFFFLKRKYLKKN